MSNVSDYYVMLFSV